MKKTLSVDEIFYSIQGEGPAIGQPSVFLRLADCNLKCSWCDTDAKTDSKKYVSVNKIEITFEEVNQAIIELDAHPNARLIITGGEPLVQQKQIMEYIYEYPDDFTYIDIETNGTIKPSDEFVSLINYFSVSTKLENSDNPLKMRERPNAYKYWVELINCCEDNIAEPFFKFVVCSDKDLEEIQRLQKTYDIPSKSIYLMPEATTVQEMCDKGDWIAKICMEYGYNMTTRMQLLNWGDKRGT